MKEFYLDLKSILPSLSRELTYLDGIQIIEKPNEITFQDTYNNELFKITSSKLLVIISDELPYSMKGLQLRLQKFGIKVNIEAPI